MRGKFSKLISRPENGISVNKKKTINQICSSVVGGGIAGTQRDGGAQGGGVEPKHLRKLVQQGPRRVGSFFKSVLPDKSAAAQWGNQF